VDALLGALEAADPSGAAHALRDLRLALVIDLRGAGQIDVERLLRIDQHASGARHRNRRAIADEIARAVVAGAGNRYPLLIDAPGDVRLEGARTAKIQRARIERSHFEHRRTGEPHRQRVGAQAIDGEPHRARCANAFELAKRHDHTRRATAGSEHERPPPPDFLGADRKHAVAHLRVHQRSPRHLDRDRFGRALHERVIAVAIEQDLAERRQ